MDGREKEKGRNIKKSWRKIRKTCIYQQIFKPKLIFNYLTKIHEKYLWFILNISSNFIC